MKDLKLFSFLSLFLTFVNSKAEASEGVVASGSESNVILIAMATLAVVLILVIFVLAGVLKAAVKSKLVELSKAKQAAILLVFMMFSVNIMAQDTPVKSSIYEAAPIAGMHPMLFYTLFVVLILEIFVILWMCLIILRLVVKPKMKAAVIESEEKKPSFFTQIISRKIFGVSPVESDIDVMLDHEYDGIRELDNDLPPWWKYGFYLTILSAVIYFVSYHVTHTSLSSIEEYELEMKEAEASIAAYRSEKALNVDESNAIFTKEVDKINEGKAIYLKNCSVCHGNEGQGLVGPNFSDKYWIYGNQPSHLFGIVKNGTAKGMKAWKDELSPVEIQNVISYIHTFQGTNPAMPKAAEGDLFDDSNSEGPTSNADSGDSMKILEIKE